MVWFINHYRCPDCGVEWDDEWSCMCDDECPSCGTRDISPVDSDEIEGGDEEECSMPSIFVSDDRVSIHIRPEESRAWAAGAHGNGAWPCSVASGKRIAAEFDQRGLVDLTVSPVADIPSAEFNALVATLAHGRLRRDHPCYGVVVGDYEPPP